MGSKALNEGQNGSKWLKIGPKWLKMAENGGHRATKACDAVKMGVSEHFGAILSHFDLYMDFSQKDGATKINLYRVPSFKFEIF